MAWRNCAASLTLVAEINARWPGRDKASDGTIGDAAHATRSSDHNPWVVVDGIGVVRARDIDKDGIDAAWLAEYLRQLGARRDPRLGGGGYVIFNHRITNPDFGSWRAYTGSNPHTAHVHVSFSTARNGFDSTAPWGISSATTAPQEDIMATIDELRAVLREFNPASKNDLQWARDQICAGIGVDPQAAPPVLTPEQIEERAVARRVDVGFARDQVLTAVAEVATEIEGVDVEGLIAKVKAALDNVEVHLSIDTEPIGS